jgi:SP family facilitated glucose transporter-like MFS transporter 8
MPESPHYLLMKNKESEAIEALKWLRDPECDILKEIDEISAHIGQHKLGERNFRETFLNKITLKAIIVAYGLMLFFTLNGANIVMTFANDIFDAADTGISSNLSSIVLACVNVLATYIAVFTVDNVGRRFLLISSCAIMSICLFLLSFYYMMKSAHLEFVDRLNYLPLSVLSLYSVS